MSSPSKSSRSGKGRQEDLDMSDNMSDLANPLPRWGRVDLKGFG